MDTFFENARRIFEVATSEASDSGRDRHDEFAVLVRPDGGLHILMENTPALDSAALAVGARTAYRVSRSGGAVRVEGREDGRRCLLQNQEPKRAWEDLLRDVPAYTISSPLLTSGPSLTTGSSFAAAMRFA